MSRTADRTDADRTERSGRAAEWEGWSAVWRAVVLAPVSWRSWVAYAHLMTGCLLGLTALLVLAPVLLLALSPPLALPVAAVLATVIAALLLACTRWLTAWQRRRFGALLGVRLAPFPGRDRESMPRRRWVVLTALSAGTWRQLLYHLTIGAVSFAGVLAWVFCWAFGAVLVTLPASAALLTHRGDLAAHSRGPLAWAALSALGMALFLAAPWLARGTVALDVAMARALLQPSERDELARRVETLSASRAGALDAADAERRRIERDLHDGAQQRLVSLAMNLGMTRAALAEAPPEVREAVAGAHEEAKQALAELRGFVRGLHPAILDEMGLDAALSGIAARSPVPVRLTVRLPSRPPSTVEAVAYFLVSEALTNTAKHAAASRVDVVVAWPGPGRLLVSVTDDGHGGADPARGSGLRGLRQRVAAVDGTLRIDSPPGGPTSIVAELPCGS
jgi:signal transduction histidine kinase